MNESLKNALGVGAIVAGALLVGVGIADVGAPEPAPLPPTHVVESTPTPTPTEAGIRPCVTEDETPTVGACYWDGGDNGEGRTFTVFSDGTVKYDTPGKLGG